MYNAFAALTDGHRMRELLRPHLPALLGAPHELLACEVMHAWRKTYAKPQSWHKSYMDVCYRLRLADRATALVHGTAYYRSRRQALDAAAQVALATLSVGELDLLLHRFPDDLALPQLHALANLPRVPQYLPAGALPAGASVRDVKLEVVNYRIGERCTLRYDVALDSGAVVTLFAKTYQDERGERIYRDLLQLHATPGLRVAQPLGYDSALRALWQRGEAGTRALDLTGTQAREDALRALAQALAGLHGVKLNYERVALRRQLWQECGKRAEKLAEAYPALAPLLREALRRCADELAALPLHQPALLHGDAHMNQFLLSKGEAILFDFDELAGGDAEYDLANVIVSLLLDAGWAAASVPVFLRAYERSAARAVDVQSLAWHYRLQLLSKAYRAFWRQAPGAQALVERAIILNTEAPPWQ